MTGEMRLALLRAALRAEFNRQADESRSPGACVYNEDVRTIGLDGEFNLDEMAEAIMKVCIR